MLCSRELFVGRHIPIATYVLGVIGAWLLMTSSAFAQSVPVGEPNPADVRVRIGPLYMNPTIALTNLGVDTNVFNEATDQNPKRDFTAIVEPSADLWLRMGRTWITARIAEQVVWFQKYSNQRSSNNQVRLGWTVPLNRLSFQANGSYIRTRERPGFEIDARAQRDERGIDGTAEFRLLAKTFFGIRGTTTRVNFDEGQKVGGQDLRVELNRTSRTMALTIRNQLTPLTNLTFEFGRVGDRFEFSTLRDTDSTRVTAGLTFDPFALLKGNATVGYRRFRPLDNALPGFTGLTTAVDLSYVLLGSTRFNATVSRDVEYSLDINQPYYLQTGFTASIAQQLFGPIDVVGRFGRHRLAYRDRAGAAVEAPNRVDFATTYGGGFGYHVGRNLRIGVNIDQSNRESPIEGRRYEGLKFGTTVVYGL
jgi:hypothetical protein